MNKRIIFVLLSIALSGLFGFTTQNQVKAHNKKSPVNKKLLSQTRKKSRTMRRTTMARRTSNEARQVRTILETKVENAIPDEKPLAKLGNSINDSISAKYPTIVSGGVVCGKASRLVKPPYPAEAKAAKVSGTVNVQVVIDEKGDVIEAQAVSGHPLLQASAEQAALASKFSPTQISGRFVKVSGIIVYNFVAP